MAVVFLSNLRFVSQKGAPARVWGMCVTGLSRQAGLALSTSAFALLLTSPAWSVNECGPDTVGPGTNTCANAAYLFPTANVNGIAIEYLNSDGLTLNFTNPLTTIAAATGTPFAGLFLGGTNDLTVNATSIDSITGFARGIVVRHDGPTGTATINLDGANIQVEASPNPALYSYGAFVTITAGSNADGAITVTDSNIVQNSPGVTAGVMIYNAGSGGDAAIVLNNTTIESRGVSASAANSLISNVTSTGTASVVMNGGSILTAQGLAGNHSGGLIAHNLGLGDAYVEVNNATINIRGVGNVVPFGNNSLISLKGGVAAVIGNAFPSIVQNSTSTATARAVVNGGSVTVGDMIYANGVSAINWASGGALAEVTGADVVTLGENANGVVASTQGNTANVSDAVAVVIGGTVTTSGVNSAGVAGYSSGPGVGRVEISGGALITVNGGGSAAASTRSRGQTIVNIQGAGTTLTAVAQDSSGILSRQLTAGATSTFDVFVGGGVVVTGGTGIDSAGIEIDSQLGNTGIIQVANGALIDGSNGRAGIWDKDGDATVTTAGEVRGGIDTGRGEDTVNLLAGSLTAGGVDTGSENDTVNSGGNVAGVFATLTGGIVTGDGEDTVTLAGGSVISGGLNTGADDDIFTIGSSTTTVSSLIGGINAGTGDDTGLLAAGSVVAGDILMADGSDTLTIDGAADITGTTAIDGGDDTSPADGFIDILHLNGGVRSFDGGDLTNWETVNLTGGADITFSGGALVTGSAAGTGPHGQPYGLTVQSGAFARFDGAFIIDGNLNNAGTVDLTTDGALGTILNVQSDYVGTAGSSLLIDVFLEDGGLDNVPSNDAPISDQLLVQGDASGTTSVFVTNLAGPGNYTDLNQNGTVDNNEGILFAQVEGNSSTGLFTLGGPVTVGAFTYDLVAFDPASSASGFWDYVLANRFSSPSQGYETYPRAVMFTMPTLHQRVGNRHWTGRRQPEVAGVEIFCKDASQNYRCTITEEQAAYYDDEKLIEESSAWVRIVGSHANITPTFSTTGVTYDVTTAEVQVGIDRLLRENDNGSKWIGGLNAQISTSHVAGDDPSGDASMKATGLGIGGTLTYYRPNGFYTDIQARVMGVSTDFTSASSGSYNNAQAAVLSASVEVGRKYELKNGWRVVPQAQVTYTQARFRSFVDSAGAVVNPDDAESLKVRVGVAVGRERVWEAEDGTTKRLEVEAGLHLHKELAGRTRVNVSNTPLYNEEDDTTAEITLGATYNWKNDRNSIYGEIGVQTGLRKFGQSRRIAGTVGFRRKWD